MRKNHYDRNGVRIGLKKNNVVTVHNTSWYDDLKWYDGYKNIQKEVHGVLGLVHSWGCVIVQIGNGYRSDGRSHLCLNDKDLEVIGTL